MRLAPSKKYDFKTLFDFEIVGVLAKQYFILQQRKDSPIKRDWLSEMKESKEMERAILNI